MWDLKETQIKLEFNPMIIQTTSFLLIFLTEAETYQVMKILIENSLEVLSSPRKDLRSSMRWHFTMTETDFHK